MTESLQMVMLQRLSEFAREQSMFELIRSLRDQNFKKVKAIFHRTVTIERKQKFVKRKKASFE